MCRADLDIRSYDGEQRTIFLFNKKDVGVQHVTVGELRQRAVKEFPKSGPSASKLRMIVVDRPLDNDSIQLCQCGVEAGSVVQMVRMVHGG